jgi:hypothetical protein
MDSTGRTAPCIDEIHIIMLTRSQKDGLQWLIDECYAAAAKGDVGQLDPKRVAHRLLLVNDISLHSTSFTVQNVILDLFSSDPAMGYVDALRDEAASVLAKAGGVWTRDAVRDLKLIDSMIRESMRLNPFAIVGLPRTVCMLLDMRYPKLIRLRLYIPKVFGSRSPTFMYHKAP